VRRALPTVAICLAALPALLAGGCGRSDNSTPTACLEGAGVYMTALRAAPGAVALEDGTPISDCLIENQSGGELATVGEALVVAATRLDAKAREDPGGDANLQLGYLLGAAQRGADGTSGIHEELVRRLAVAARYSPDNRPLPPTFLETYREGFDAGHTRG
jgi:hypothetical protein